MKMKVYKYPINIGGESIINVPIMSKFLSVKSQRDEVVVYFSVPVDNPSLDKVESHRFYVVDTGREFELDNAMAYIDTVMLNGDNYVFHIFKKYCYPTYAYLNNGSK